MLTDPRLAFESKKPLDHQDNVYLNIKEYDILSSQTSCT